MLKYVISVSEDLLLCSVLMGMLYAFAHKNWDKRGQYSLIGATVLAWTVALVISILKKQTRLIDSGLWNLRFVGIYLLGLLLFLASFIPMIKRAKPVLPQRLQQAALALLTIGVTGYTAPEPLTYPTVILQSVKSPISTDFFFRMVGWLFGLLVMLLLALATYHVLMSLADKLAQRVAVAGTVFVGLVLAALALRALLTRRIIPQSPVVFQIAAFASNNGTLFGMILGAATLICAAVLIARSLHIQEPYDNPAQHRKIQAKWRRRRRWATVAVVCLALTLVNVTVVKAYDSREVELSPSEEFELREDGCYIPLSQLEDGHLHRFTYESPDKVGIRFIIIRKPGGAAYGVGLDACDICGETGYFERDDQVVCKLCDVVMNVQTIGFKGGCNPIVIDYSIKDGYIIVPFDTLLEHEVIFTR
ncbi:MAG: DUF2318 domain-containing protein [Atopobiaceae bacterium]|nr:DUF2318 domain-containing protein [Atopobiaceae bacterium]